MPSETAHIFAQRDTEVPLLLPFAGGSVAVYTQRCPGKESPNEDSVAVIPGGPDSGILVVADGVGGGRAGKEASAAAVESLQQAIFEASADRTDLRSAILDGIERANRSILDRALGAATTLSIVEINGDDMRPYHVGDSVILLVGQRGKVKLATIAHSPVGHALEAGVIDEHEAMHHEERHLVTNVVGTTDMRIEIGSTVSMSQRDTLLLASDGLSDNLSQSEIIDTIRHRSLATQARILVAEARNRMVAVDAAAVPSKPDDLSVLIFRRTFTKRVPVA